MKKLHIATLPLINQNLLLRYLFRVENGKINWFRSTLLLYLPSIFVIISCLVEGTFFDLPKTNGLGLLEHPGLIAQFVLFPIIILSSVLVIINYSCFIKTLPEICTEKHESNHDSIVGILLTDISRTIETGYLKLDIINILGWFLLIVGIICSLLNIYNTVDSPRQLGIYGHDTFDTINYPLGFVSTKIFIFFYWGIFSPIAVKKILQVIVTLNYVFKKIRKAGILRVNPLHPDNAGGLGELGKISLKLNYTVGISTLFLITLYMSHGSLYYTLSLGTILIIVMLFVVFFLPLHEAHKAMKEAKIKLLDKISNSYKPINRGLINKILLSDNPNKIFDSEGDDIYDTHQKLSEIFQHINKLPTWPYDITTFSRFIGTLLIPTIMLIMELVIKSDNIISIFQRLPK